MTEPRDSLQRWTQTIATTSPRVSRREIVEALGAVGMGLVLLGSRVGQAQCALPARNPIEGPYFLGDPEEKLDTGKGLIVQGTVRDAVTCEPVPNAVVVRWHANAAGQYEEYYRAKMSLKSNAQFEMSTIPPGQYANLDRHIHWYVTAPGYRPVIAQLQWRNTTLIQGTETFDFSLTK
jgi:hypothetical protein